MLKITLVFGIHFASPRILSVKLNSPWQVPPAPICFPSHWLRILVSETWKLLVALVCTYHDQTESRSRFKNILKKNISFLNRPWWREFQSFQILPSFIKIELYTAILKVQQQQIKLDEFVWIYWILQLQIYLRGIVVARARILFVI